MVSAWAAPVKMCIRDSHRCVLRVVEDEFKSHDFGSAKELLLHDLPAERATVLYDVDEKQILERLKAIIEVKERSETTVPITQEHIDKVKKYLLMPVSYTQLDVYKRQEQ